MSTNQHERLRDARIKAGFKSAAAAAEAYGWNVSTYRHHENSTRGFGQDHAKSYARAFNVSAAWLLGLQSDPYPDAREGMIQLLSMPDRPSGELPELDESLRLETGQALVHHYEVTDFNGHQLTDFPIFRDPERKHWFKAYDLELLKRLAKVEISQICSVSASDDAMAPTIKEGAILLVDVGATEVEQQDAIWLVSVGDKAMIRRLFIRPGGTIAVSADAVRDRHYEFEPTDVQVRGRVVWIGQSA